MSNAKSSRDSIMETLNNFGHIILKSVSYEDCVRTYGPLFVDWYDQNIITCRRAA